MIYGVAERTSNMNIFAQFLFTPSDNRAHKFHSHISHFSVSYNCFAFFNFNLKSHTRSMFVWLRYFTAESSALYEWKKIYWHIVLQENTINSSCCEFYVRAALNKTIYRVVVRHNMLAIFSIETISSIMVIVMKYKHL